MLDVGEPVLDRVVAPVFLRLPVRVVPLPFGREVPPAMSRGGTTSLAQARTSATVEYPSRQSHIAGAPNGITFADQHGNQHEQPEHHERYPQQRLRDAWHDDLLSSVPIPASPHRWPARPGQSAQGNYTPVIHLSQAPHATRVAPVTVWLRFRVRASWHARHGPASRPPTRKPLRR